MTHDDAAPSADKPNQAQRKATPDAGAPDRASSGAAPRNDAPAEVRADGAADGAQASTLSPEDAAALRAALAEVDSRMEKRSSLRVGKGTMQAAVIFAVIFGLVAVYWFGQVRPRGYPPVETPDRVEAPLFGLSFAPPEGFRPVAGKPGRWERGAAWLQLRVQTIRRYPQPKTPTGGPILTSVLYARELVTRHGGRAIRDTPVRMGSFAGVEAEIAPGDDPQRRVRGVALLLSRRDKRVREVVFGYPAGGLSDAAFARTVGSVRPAPFGLPEKTPGDGEEGEPGDANDETDADTGATPYPPDADTDGESGGDGANDGSDGEARRQ